jgi:tricorn protease
VPDDRPYLRFPTLAGNVVSFAADDDVWITTLDEPAAHRLSADHAPVSNLRLSPGGTTVAYTGRRDGAPEVYVVDTAGGESRRLTFWGDNFTRVIGWSAAGHVLAITAAGQPFRSRTWAHAVPVDGGPAERLAFGPVTAVATGPGGATVLGADQSPNRGASWKRYRGGTAAKLWIDPNGSGVFSRFLTELDGQLEDPHWIGDRVVFLSDHEGYGNVYSVLADGSGLRRHSDHGDFYARALHADGTRALYQCAGDLFVVEDLAPGASPRRLEFALAGARTGRAAFPIKAAAHLGDLRPDHGGRASALEVRGSIVWLPHRDGPARVLGGGDGVGGRLPQVLGRGTTARVVWVTDAEGDDALEVAPVFGPSPELPQRLAAGALGRVLEMTAAPDASRVAVASHDGRVLVVDVATGSVLELDRSDDGDATGLTFSPDSAWLAWSHAGPEPLRQIRLAAVGGGPVVDVTPMRFNDHDPVFTLDGRYLAFLSARTFDPVYDSHVFDLSFPSGTRPYLVTLAAATPSPFDAELAGRSSVGADAGAPELGGAGDADPERSAAEAGDRPAGGDTGSAPEVVIDLDNLAERVVAVPVPAASYSGLSAVGGGLVWLHEPLVGVLGEELARPGADRPRSRVVRYDIERRRELPLVDGADAFWSTGDGKFLVVRNGSSLAVVPSSARVEPAGPGADGPSDRVDVDTGRIRLRVDPGLEWRQMYDEAARLMRDHYWTEDMADVAWDEVVDRYRPLLERISARSDLSELLWEVQGELGASHAYEEPPPRPVDELRRVGLLGADLAQGADGRWRVVAVLPGESSVPGARSPLLAPGASVAPGEVLVAVDGVRIDPLRGPGPTLAGSANKPVALTVEDLEGNRRDVVVTPLADDRALRYQAWVADRRATVHQRSGGLAGYLHIPDMMGAGWAQLHRDLRVEVTRDSLVVDLRDNAGGHTSQLVVEKLARTVLGWDVVRHHNVETYPADAPRGPLVAVVNEQAGSDGDIATAAIKLRGLAPVVGTRTWGGVIGIDGRYHLVDGTGVTQPRYAFWFKELGWAVENHGVDPDIEVAISPQDWATGEDPQLEVALATLAGLRDRRPSDRPPEASTRPSRRPPVLPSRP